MACFLVPAAEAVAVSAAARVLRAREADAASMPRMETETKLPLSRKLGWLSNLLWGGSALLAYEHVWHGEIVPWFPFLTAAENPVAFAEMLHEMSTVGVTMALAVTGVWAGIAAVVRSMERRALTEGRLAK